MSSLPIHRADQQGYTIFLTGGDPLGRGCQYIAHIGRVFWGIILRNHRGKIVAGDTCWSVTHDALSVEALVLRVALSFASNLDMDQILVESDNLKIVKIWRGGMEIRGSYNILQDINRLRRNFHICGFTWVGRQGNLLAHAVAELVRQSGLPRDWVCRPPYAMVEVLQRDLVMIPSYWSYVRFSSP